MLSERRSSEVFQRAVVVCPDMPPQLDDPCDMFFGCYTRQFANVKEAVREADSMAERAFVELINVSISTIDKTVVEVRSGNPDC